MPKHIKLKTIFLLFCCASLIFTGCSSASDTEANAEVQAANAEFDALTREMFIDYAAMDTLTLNYTLKDPSAYGIEMDEVTWGDVPVTKEDFEDYKEDTLDYLEQLDNITGLTGERAITYDVLKYYLEADLESYDYIYFTNNFAPMLGIQSQFPITRAEYYFDDVPLYKYYTDFRVQSVNILHFQDSAGWISVDTYNTAHIRFLPAGHFLPASAPHLHSCYSGCL